MRKREAQHDSHRHEQDILYDQPSYSHLAVSRDGERAYLGSFAGLYRRDGRGPWVYLETITQLITSLAVGADRGLAPLQPAVGWSCCDYHTHGVADRWPPLRHGVQPRLHIATRPSVLIALRGRIGA